MSIYETPMGYVVRETTSGLDVYTDTKMEHYVCELGGVSLDNFRDDNDDVDDDKLEDAINEQIEVEDIIAMNADY